jgi:UDP-hydrolysing UDP-N-acetyl-D-glucosamine 2-epimerase
MSSNRKSAFITLIQDSQSAGANVETNSKRKVCVVLVDRANYGRLKPVLRAITERPQLQLQLVAAGTMVLERFGHPVQNVKNDGFVVDGEIYIELEGSTPATMAKSLGFAVVEFASEFQRLKPDVVILIGDRYEALAAALAAAYMNICIVHIQGGEVSGSIDESARHAITKLAHYHFPSTERSAKYLVRMGEAPESILGIGCPSSDIARTLAPTMTSELINSTGSGAQIDINQPVLLVVFHPTTTAYGGERQQVNEILRALGKLHMQTIMLWPNIDAGADHISKAIRLFRDREAPTWLRTLTNLSPEHYLNLLGRISCAVGNSSSFVRDAGYFGTPVVLVGDRQEGRETDEHVTRIPPVAAQLIRAIRKQLRHGLYAPSSLYGDGLVSNRIADGLVRLQPYVQKTLHYIYDEVTKDRHDHPRAWDHSRTRRLEGYLAQEPRAAAR